MPIEAASPGQYKGSVGTNTNGNCTSDQAADDNLRSFVRKRYYGCRTAIHVASAEGHEKIVEYLLLSLADANCKDRWECTPLQDALAGGHIGTAHLLKAKGALVPEAFGSGAVCSAAGKGDVPTLRILHSFGQ